MAASLPPHGDRQPGTEPVTAEVALRDTEQRLNELMDGLWDGVLDLSADQAQVLYLNTAAARILGRPLPDLYRQTRLLTAYCHPEDLPTVERAVAHLERDGHLDQEWRIHHPGGEVRWLHLRARVTHRPDGTPLHVEGLMRDVTLARQQEEALRRSEASFRAMIEHAPDAVVVTRGGRTVYANSAAVRLTGAASGQELVGTAFVDLLHPDDRDAFAAAGDQQANTPWRLCRRDGSLASVDVSSLTLDFMGQPAVLLMARDQTEKQKLQAGLVLSERLASMGMLVAGVAHEINNPLAFLLPNLHLALAELEQLLGEEPAPARVVKTLGDVRAALVDALDGAQRVRKTVADLKAFSRAPGDAPTRVDLRAVMESALNIARAEIRHRAALVRDYREVPDVLGQEAQLGQVFINLLVNAAQAIPAGAMDLHRITVRTFTAPDGGVVAEVQDTGPGIAPQHLARVFDPFFTTKPAGVGTGLGLSVCQRIITHLGGTISVDSRPGLGATFRVTLPAAAAPAGTSTPQPPASSPRVARSRVVVVDDEPLAAASVKRGLAADHDVDVWADAAGALEAILEEPPDVVVCDVMMPGMDGMAFHRALRERAPHLAARVVFVTGAMLHPAVRTFLDGVPNQRLEKPFDLGQLKACIHAVVSVAPREPSQRRT